MVLSFTIYPLSPSSPPSLPQYSNKLVFLVGHAKAWMGGSPSDRLSSTVHTCIWFYDFILFLYEMILLHLLIIIMYMDGWHGVRMDKLPSQCTRGMIHRVDMPRCTGAGPGGASIVQAAASHDIVHGWMARCVHGCQCIQHAHGPVQIAWGMHQCTMSGSIHPSIMHGWIHLCIRPCMMRERERRSGLYFF